MRIDILIEIGLFRNKQGPFQFLPGLFWPLWPVLVIIVTSDQGLILYIHIFETPNFPVSAYKLL